MWLERAWRGGLRTTTLFASHVESLCKTSLKATREVSWPICEDSMRHIVDQLIVARDFERFIDWQNGGPGQGWFRIVTTPEQARDAMRAGKLAVVARHRGRQPVQLQGSGLSRRLRSAGGAHRFVRAAAADDARGGGGL